MQKRKLGDFVSKVDPTDQELEEDRSVVFAWLPGLARWGVGLPDPQEEWSLAGHIPLLRYDDEPVSALEW